MTPRAAGGHLKGARPHMAKTPGSSGLRSPGLEESEVTATRVDCSEAVGNSLQKNAKLKTQNARSLKPVTSTEARVINRH